jgi:hypothetical protein
VPRFRRSEIEYAHQIPFGQANARFQVHQHRNDLTRREAIGGKPTGG